MAASTSDHRSPRSCRARIEPPVCSPIPTTGKPLREKVGRPQGSTKLLPCSTGRANVYYGLLIPHCRPCGSYVQRLQNWHAEDKSVESVREKRAIAIFSI